MTHSIPGGRNFRLRLQRTLRVPNDGRKYPLPPGLGDFPLYEPPDLKKGTLPAADYYVPMYASEAMWLRFEVPEWTAYAVQVAAGGVNLLTAGRFTTPGRLARRPQQNYVACPEQPWLDGIRTEAGSVRQFVATPMGAGLSVEEQMSGAVAEGGLTITVVPPKPGLFRKPRRGTSIYALEMPAAMGLAAGGEIEQKIYPDPRPLAIYDTAKAKTIRIRLIDSAQFHKVTGHAPPPTPVTAEAYARYGLPWFALYDERHGDIGATGKFRALKTVGSKEKLPDRLPTVKIRKEK